MTLESMVNVKHTKNLSYSAYRELSFHFYRECSHLAQWLPMVCRLTKVSDHQYDF